eukprot:scaffold17045_cov71-Attheya_sp.AAC.2
MSSKTDKAIQQQQGKPAPIHCSVVLAGCCSNKNPAAPSPETMMPYQADKYGTKEGRTQGPDQFRMNSLDWLLNQGS